MTRAPWYIAGPLLGLLIVALRATVNRPLGVLGGYIELAERVSQPRRLGISSLLVLGFVLGGALYAVTLGVFSPSPGYAVGTALPATPALQRAVLLLAGVAMGIGARTAGGCTSGHGLSGMSLGSPASLVATMTFFATGVLVAHLLAWL